MQGIDLRMQRSQILVIADYIIGMAQTIFTFGLGLQNGAYVTPALFTDVDNSMTIAREEIFGPVLTVIPYDDVEDAVRIANDSDYGLSGSVWTAEVDRGLAVARRVRTGTFGVNQPYSMDPVGPFGGVKASGFGHELGSEGLDEFLDTKAISVAPIP